MTLYATAAVSPVTYRIEFFPAFFFLSTNVRCCLARFCVSSCVARVTTGGREIIMCHDNIINKFLYCSWHIAAHAIYIYYNAGGSITMETNAYLSTHIHILFTLTYIHHSLNYLYSSIATTMDTLNITITEHHNKYTFVLGERLCTQQ